jgi:D-3-phosphoglycerate dehydrogenase / 2-oxoglutarate reductase
MHKKILFLNKISLKSLGLFVAGGFGVGNEVPDPNAILVRSAEVKSEMLTSDLEAIARAGAGTNNIPVNECTEKGIVVFNTPGANANGVKELVIVGLLLSSRNIVDGISWAKGLVDKGEEVPNLIEKGKGKFAGNEILGKKIGVIGMGAIGNLVAKAADALGMEVSGFDPYVSQEVKQILPRNVEIKADINQLLTESDFITLHLPLGKDTKGFINNEKFAVMKKGAKLLNFARRELVDLDDLKKAIKEGVVASYVTDFPDAELLMLPEVIGIPHLGASTEEAEENCAIMAAEQLIDFLTNGNVKNSVNFPGCILERTGKKRLTVANQNKPGMIEKITHLLADNGINVAEMLNKSKGEIAYNIIDVDGDINEQIFETIKAIEGVIWVKVL